MPQLHDACAHLRFVGGQFTGAQCVFFVLKKSTAHFDFVALSQKPGDAAFGVQNAFALHFGRVSCQYWRHIALRKRIGDGFGRNTGPAQARHGNLHAALLRVTCAFVDGAAADVVAVFGQIGQMGEIREGADYADRLVAA